MRLLSHYPPYQYSRRIDTVAVERAQRSDTRSALSSLLRHHWRCNDPYASRPSLIITAQSCCYHLHSEGVNAGDSQRRNLNATPASARACVGCDLIFTPRAPLRKVLTHHDILTLVEPNCILTCVLSLAELKVPQSDGRRRRTGTRRASTFGERSAAGQQHAKDRDTLNSAFTGHPTHLQTYGQNVLCRSGRAPDVGNHAVAHSSEQRRRHSVTTADLTSREVESETRRHRSLRGGRRKCSCTVLVQCACCCFMAALLVDPSERRRSSRRRDPVNVR